MKENFYVKSDGTRVYYFNEKHLRQIIQDAANGPAAKLGQTSEGQEAEEIFEVEVVKIETHHRTIRNVKRNLEMNRVWIQAVLHKK